VFAKVDVVFEKPVRFDEVQEWLAAE